MHAIVLGATLKRSPEQSNSEALAKHVTDALEAEGVTIDRVRLADHVIEPGVVSEAISDRDEWPAIRERVLAADIVIIATPTWLGQPTSIAKAALERMDAFLAEADEDGVPVAVGKVAGIVVAGNEDGAHHVIAEIGGALNDIGFTQPGQNWTYWNKGPGPGEEEYLTSDEQDWSHDTARTCAHYLLATARAFAANPIPAPPS